MISMIWFQPAVGHSVILELKLGPTDATPVSFEKKLYIVDEI
jgi:hypothetical protein